MSDAVPDEVRGRHIRSGDRWLIDFASCNYLGFDQDPEIIQAIEPAVRRWGTHASRSRLLCSTRLYPEIEERLAALLGAPDTLLLPTATLIHASVIPHRGAHGGGAVSLRFARRLRRRHTGETYDAIVLVGGFSKAYSSLPAFLALPSRLKDRLKTAAGPYLYSGPSPTASLATALAGLTVNDRRGDGIRADLYRKTARVLRHVHGLALDTPGVRGFPIVEIPLADASDLDAVARFLWDRGVYVTLAAHTPSSRGTGSASGSRSRHSTPTRTSTGSTPR